MLLNMFEFDWIKIQMLSSTKTEIEKKQWVYMFNTCLSFYCLQVNKYKCTMDSGQQVSHWF